MFNGMSRRKKYILKMLIAGITILVLGIFLGKTAMMSLKGVIQDAISNANFIVLIGFSSLMFSYLNKLVNSFTFNRMQLTRNIYLTDDEWKTTIPSVDLLIPILGEFRLLYLYRETVYDTYGEDEDIAPLLKFLIRFTKFSLIGNLVLFYSILILGGIFIQIKYGLFRFTDVHLLYCVVLYLVYVFQTINITIIYTIMMLGYKDWIYGYNTTFMTAKHLIFPIIFVINIFLILINFVGVNFANIPLFNIIGFILLPIINPILIQMSAKKVYSEVTVSVEADNE